MFSFEHDFKKTNVAVMRKKLVVFISIVLILGFALFIMNTLKSMKPDPGQANVIIKKDVVQTRTIKYLNLTTRIEGTGRVTSQFDVTLASEVQGKVLAGNVTLKKGESFIMGDLLARIYDEDFKYSLKARKSGFLTLLANILPDLKVDYPTDFDAWADFFDMIEMDKDLPEMPEISSKQLKIFLSSRKILSEYYAIQSDELRLDKYYIYAPFDGAFTEVYAEVGSVASPGGRLASMIKTGKLEVEVPIDLNEAQYVKTGNSATISSSQNSNIEWIGKVSRIADFVDPNTQSINVYVSVPNNKTFPLFKGQYLKVVLDGVTLENVMELSRTAVSNGNHVYTVEEGKLVHRTIDIKKIYNETLLFNGIDEGISIVSEPLVKPVEGTEVETFN